LSPIFEDVMLMKYFILASLIALTACTSTPKENQLVETQACMTYRSMMVAPMPPTEHERLRLACEQSKQ
jgi:starvation-inducible outer membrane lipoprotein